MDSLVYDYMISQKDNYHLKVKVIHKSPEWASPPIVVSPNIDPEIRFRLREAFLSMA